MAPSYPQFYGGGAQVPSRDADFEAWHGPVNVVPQQQAQQQPSQQQQQMQQQQGLLPAAGFQLPAPSFASTLGMPELPPPSGSQVSPPAILLWDALARAQYALGLRLLCAGGSLYPARCRYPGVDDLANLPSSVWPQMPSEHAPPVAVDPSHDDFVHTCRGSRAICSSTTRATAPWVRSRRSPIPLAACRLVRDLRRSSQALGHRSALVPWSTLMVRNVWPPS